MPNNSYFILQNTEDRDDDEWKPVKDRAMFKVVDDYFFSDQEDLEPINYKEFE